MLKTLRSRDLKESEKEALCRRNPPADEATLRLCREIFEQVGRRGDAAVREYTERWDQVKIDRLEIEAESLDQALGRLCGESLAALRRAARNIETFHARQAVAEAPVRVEPGVECWLESRPVESVGLYVPGGRAVLPSTALMLGIPARLAGCPRRILCVPPGPDGSVANEVLAAARIAGVQQIFRIGGAQAVAAMALGTESVPRVDKIFGPGNRFVQTAKMLATLHGTAIDMVAGPSEVLVVADASANSKFVAADLLSQSEHGPDSLCILVSDSESQIRRVNRELAAQWAALPRKTDAAASLRGSFALLAGTPAEALEFANRYAPEHLILHLSDARRWARSVASAGSVFIGPWSPEAAGDYATGPNHTLPTSGAARACSGVSLASFVKKIAFQQLTRRGLSALAPTLETLARMEGLEGHARAVQERMGEV